jgi:hypothetical protein
MVKVVYDTNVVVSAALKPGSLPAALGRPTSRTTGSSSAPSQRALIT